MSLRINKHKIFSTALNVIGLTLAFSVFLVLMVQVIYDLGYDRGYPGADKIVRFEFTNPTTPGVYSSHTCRPVFEYLKEHLPQAEAVSCLQPNGWDNFKEANTEETGSILYSCASSDDDLVRVFPFKFTQGNPSDYQSPEAALISESAAKKLFGKQSPIGKYIQKDIPHSDFRRIVAVYQDFPENSSMNFDLIFNMGDLCINDRSEWSFQGYIKLNTTEGLQATLDSLRSVLYSSQADNIDIRLNRLHDVHFSKDLQGGPMGNFSTTMALLSVAILVVLIAIINFINFAMASVPFIIKGINTRRVMGSTRGQQIRVQLGRALLLVLLAFGLSVGVMSLVATSPFAAFISGSLRVEDNLPLVFIGLGVAVVISLIAGIFPARYSTSFNPALVLKGSFALSAKGRAMRTVLVGFQYVISFILVICSLFITVQVHYMTGFDMGFNREEVVEFFVDYKIGKNIYR